MNTKSGLFIGLALATSLGTTSLAQVHQPTLATLPDWVRSHCRPDQTLRIALVGCAPYLQDERLQPDSNSTFRIIAPPPSQGYEPTRADTELLVWLRSVWPRMTVWVVPNNKSKPSALVEALDWTVKQNPDVIVGLERDSPLIQTILSNCYRVGCLPIAVLDGRDHPPLPGILGVALIPDKELIVSKVADPKDYEGCPVSLCLPESCLEGAPEMWNGRSRAVMAYLALVSSILPVRGMPSLLERASLLGLVSPVMAQKGMKQRFYRIIDPVAAMSYSHGKFSYTGKYNNWDDKVGDEKSFFNIAEKYHGLDEESRRIIASIRGKTHLRHLAAIEELMQLRTIILVRFPPKAIAVFRSETKLKPDFLSILETQTSKKDPHFPFTSVAEDIKIGIKPSRR